MIYKCINKSTANGLKGVLPDIIDEAKITFIPVRMTSENIFLARDLLFDYHKKKFNRR